MPSIDGGPKDASRARAFLLTILRETSIRVILLPHHDLKPSRDGKDDRARPERASGGVTFSMGDCMVNFERLNDRECLAVPTSYKVGADPKPFRVRFETRDPIRSRASAASCGPLQRRRTKQRTHGLGSSTT